MGTANAEATPVDLKESSIIKCERRNDWSFVLESDGKVILDKTFEKSEGVLIPAFKFKGTTSSRLGKKAALPLLLTRCNQ